MEWLRNRIDAKIVVEQFRRQYNGVYSMSGENSPDYFVDVLKELLSDNDQTPKVVNAIAENKTGNGQKLVQTKSIGNIAKHPGPVRALLLDVDEAIQMHHCEGMERLVE